MAVRSNDLKPYKFVDEEDEAPKTVWHVIPFTQWDVFTYQDIDANNLQGATQKKVISGFIKEKIVKIENFEVDGEMKILEIEDIQKAPLRTFPLDAVLKVYADSLSRIEVKDEEAKNSE